MTLEETISSIGVIICIVSIIIYLFPPSAKTVIEVANKNGFKKIKSGSSSFFGCSDSDRMGRKFTATNINGLEISGVVCCGLLKNCTIRF